MRHLTLLALPFLLAGCVTPMMSPHLVTVTASKPGTVILHRGQQCIAPCVMDVRDDFGFYSRYSFIAKRGDTAKEIVVEESRWLDAQGVVPARLHFDLGD